MPPAAAATLAARRVAGVVAVVSLVELLIVGCSGGDSGREIPPPTDAGLRDVEKRDATRKDVEAKDAGRPDVHEAGDGAPVDADALAVDADAGPMTTFDGALWVNSGTCNLGEIGATFRGIPAYCQPGIAGCYGYYQCDELANRFMRDSLRHPDLDNVVTEFASSICARASTMSAYSVWGPGYRSTIGLAPVGGDLLVFPSTGASTCPDSGSPGHVAVVVGFSSATELMVMQQNGGPSVVGHPWDSSSSFVVGAECWVHAESAPPAELPDGSACGCIAGGDTCGLAIVDHEWWNGCTATVPEAGVAYGSLYACEGGVYTKTADCPDLCITPDMFDASGYCGK